MSLSEDIYEYLKEGPKTDSELQRKFNAPLPSVRRSRQQLVKANKVVKGGKVEREFLWGRAGGTEVAQVRSTAGVPAHVAEEST